jgi:1-aminocyclopropane-1-carboxylate deaminase/D-cysteine desulfhydrase-like pyridoxal-dependent ACC family enzyme
MGGGRALFERLPRLADLVPFLPLADGLPTPVEQVEDELWVQRDDLTASGYGGNKVRKLEFVLPVAARRGGPLVTAGGIGSHHVLAAAFYGHKLGLPVDAVLYPQPATDDVRHTAHAIAALGVAVTAIGNRYLMPVALARRLAALAPRQPYLLWPGASTPLGTLGYVSAGIELADAFDAAGEPEPDLVVVPFGSGGTAVGVALGLAVAGWTGCRVLAVRVADRSVANPAVARALEAGTSALLALGGWRPRPARLDITGAWFGAGYGHRSTPGREAARIGASLGLALEPTYTEKAFAAALAEYRRGARIVFVQTYAGPASASLTPSAAGSVSAPRR